MALMSNSDGDANHSEPFSQASRRRQCLKGFTYIISLNLQTNPVSRYFSPSTLWLRKLRHGEVNCLSKVTQLIIVRARTQPKAIWLESERIQRKIKQ